MNKKILMLLTCACALLAPKAQAMKRGFSKSFLYATRSLQISPKSFIPKSQSTTQDHSLVKQRYSREQKQEHENAHEQSQRNNPYYLPSITAAAVSLALTPQHNLDEQDKAISLNKINISDITAVLRVFKNGTKEEKQEVAKKVAQKIRTYKFEDIIAMLQSAGAYPPRILIEAISNNITYYSVAQIKEILIASNYNAEPNSHEIIAHALKKNYHYFTHNTFLGYSYAKKDGLPEYLETIEKLRWNYLHIALEPLIAEVYEAISKQIIDTSNMPAAKTNITISYELAHNIFPGHYTDQQLCALLKISDDRTQEIICRRIVDNIRNNINGHRLYQILLSVCEKNRASIANAWGLSLEHAENMAKLTGEKAEDNFIETLKDHELYELLISSNGDSQNYFLKKFLQNYNFKNGRYITDFIRGNIQKMQELAYASISNEWGLTESDWADIHHSFTKLVHSIAHATNSDEQFSYTCNVSDRHKHLITSICKERNITEKLIVKEVENKEAFAGIKTSLNAKSIEQSLQINTSHPEVNDYETMHFAFEHELGGHVRHHHGLLLVIILVTIRHKHRYKFNNFEEGVSEVPALDDIRNSASFQALLKTHEYEADLSSAIDDITYAAEVKNYAKNRKWDLSSAIDNVTYAAEVKKSKLDRPSSLYMSHNQLYRIISAIIKLKKAEENWFKSKEAYNLYGLPAYDRMLSEEQEVRPAQKD